VNILGKVQHPIQDGFNQEKLQKKIRFFSSQRISFKLDPMVGGEVYPEFDSKAK